MRRLKRRCPEIFVGLFAALLLFGVETRAQSNDENLSVLEETLEQYGSETVQGYIQPLADLFGANMHAGYYHSASIPVVGINVEFSIIGMGSMVSDDHKTYTVKTPDGFVPAEVETATVFGKEGKEVAHGANPQLRYRGSDGIIDASIFPLAVPQITVGSIMGTQGILRFISTPSINEDTFPSTTLLGLGVRHSVSQYIPVVPKPVDVAVGVFYNSFTVGDIIDFSGLSIGAQASRGFGPANLYGGLAWEKSTMNVSYTSNALSDSPVVDIDLDGENSLRLTLGGGLSLGIFKIFADINLGSVTNFSTGIGLGI